jgi:hypothetical protein
MIVFIYVIRLVQAVVLAMVPVITASLYAPLATSEISLEVIFALKLAQFPPNMPIQSKDYVS